MASEKTIKAQSLLIEAGLLPKEMPSNFTYDKVREVLAGLEGHEVEELRRAVERAVQLEVRGPLAAVIFIKHHFDGEHEVELDRMEENEETGTRYAVLIYPEGELPIKLEQMPEGIESGSRVRYDPEAKAGYSISR